MGASSAISVLLFFFLSLISLSHGYTVSWRASRVNTANNYFDVDDNWEPTFWVEYFVIIKI